MKRSNKSECGYGPTALFVNDAFFEIAPQRLTDPSHVCRARSFFWMQTSPQDPHSSVPFRNTFPYSTGQVSRLGWASARTESCIRRKRSNPKNNNAITQTGGGARKLFFSRRGIADLGISSHVHDFPAIVSLVRRGGLRDRTTDDRIPECFYHVRVFINTADSPYSHADCIIATLCPYRSVFCVPY